MRDVRTLGTMGKDWSKGLTAATDARVARSAERHRGMIYRPRTSTEAATRTGARTLALAWSPTMAYVVGLIATDGCLVGDRRHIAFTTNDRQLADTFLRCLGRPLRYGTARTAAGNELFRVQVGDVALYRWLESIGLAPRKSLTLGAILVPDELLAHLVRGLLDGDGTIANFVHAPTRRAYPSYLYERLRVRFCSASRAHLEWLGDALVRVLGVKGSLVRRPPGAGRHALYTLGFGKHASVRLLARLYEDPRAPRLERKWAIWDAFARRSSPLRSRQDPDPCCSTLGPRGRRSPIG